MKTRHLIGVILAIAGLCACNPKEENPTQEDNYVSFSAKFAEMTEGLSQPKDLVLTIDNKEIAVTDGKFVWDAEEDAQPHLISVYNKVEGVSVKDGVIEVAGAGATIPSLDWLFFYSANKKLGASLSATLQQKTKQLDIIVRAVGGKAGMIQEATAEITDVAGQHDPANKLYKGASTVSANLEPGVLSGTLFGVIRILGFVPNSTNNLKLNLKYSDGSTSSTSVDLTSQAEALNEEKTTISLISVNIADLGEASEAATVEVTADGTLENKDNTDAAGSGDKKLTIKWPSYNTASRLEVKANNVYYVSTLGAATEAGQVTDNGFASIPANGTIEEVAIYVGSERLVAPVNYMTYADGVITMEDCKLVYKPEHLKDSYITEKGLFVQTTDLRLPSDFAPIGAEFDFAGTYDGQGFSISGMNFTEEGKQEQGLFRYNKGTIMNVVLKDSKIVNAGKFSGGIAARNDSGTVKKCISYLDLTVAVDGNGGGIVGSNVTGLITGCEFHGKINVLKSGLCGGIVGTNYDGGIVENCLNTGSLEGTSYNGGVVGRNRGILRACKNTGNLTVAKGTQWTGAGGVVGRNDNNTGHVIACYNTGTITSSGGFGGLCGVCDGKESTITACYSTGLIIPSTDASLVGQVAGWFLGRTNASWIRYCYVTSEGQPKTSNGVFGNGLIDKVDVKILDGEAPEWPTEDAEKGWGIWKEGCDPTQGYYWKDLGNQETKTYPKLYWED